LYQTGLPAGTYCDVISGHLAGNACTGASISVNGGGQAIVSLGASSALAIHVGAKF
jgi:alpha-amylase